MAAKYPEKDVDSDPSSGSGRMSGFLEGNDYAPEIDIVLEGAHDRLRRRKCEKHPEHKDFHPVSELSKDKLPQNLRTEENWILIQKKIDLTVRIRVNYISTKRPNLFSDNALPYPCRDLRGQNNILCGTGTIHRVLSWDPIEQSCPCRKCEQLGDEDGSRAQEYYMFTVSTATHVVFDDAEAKSATVECFYNDDKRRDVKLLYGLNVDGTNTSYSDMYKDDVCELICVTHDIDTAKKIKNLVSSTNLPPALPHSLNYALPPEGVIVSHPHGVSKMVTFGEVRFATVPVKPEFEKLKPTFLPNPTKCRLNLQLISVPNESEEATHCIKYREDYMEMIGLIIKTTREDETRPLNRIAERIASSKQTASGSTTFEMVSNGQSQEQDIASSTNEKTENTSSETSPEEECNRLFDAVVQQSPTFPSEFEHYFHDLSGALNLMDNVETQNSSNLGDTLFQFVNAVMPSASSTLQSSRKHHTGKSVTTNELPSRQAAFANFVTTTCRRMGIEDEIVSGVCRIMQNMMPKMLDDTLPVNQQADLWGEAFTKAFQISVLHSDTNNATNKCDDRAAGDGNGGSGGDGSGSSSDDGSGNSPPSKAKNENDNSGGGGNTSVQNSLPKAAMDDEENIGECGKTNQIDVSSASSACSAFEGVGVGDACRSGDGAFNSPPLEGATAAANASHNDSVAAGKSDFLRQLIDKTHESLRGAMDKCNPLTRNLFKDMGLSRETIESFYQSYIPQDQAHVNPESEFVLPMTMNFILPQEATYTMRYHKESPGWFSFYPGTELSTDDGKTIPIAKGTEFRSDLFAPRHSYLTHTIPTCVGSSGAAIYCSLVGKEYNTFYPQCAGGRYGTERVNYSGVQENRLAGVSYTVWESMQRAQQRFIADKVDASLGTCCAAPGKSQGEGSERERTDVVTRQTRRSRNQPVDIDLD